MKRFAAFAIAIFAVLLLSCPFASAQGGNISIGKLKILPAVTLTETYDDNIFLGSGDNSTTEDEIDDLITGISPELMFNYAIPGRGAVQFGFNSSINLYADNSENDWSNINLLGRLDYTAPMGLSLNLRDVYTDAEDPYGSQNLFNIGVPTKRWSNNLSGTLGYTLREIYRVETYFSLYEQDYDLLRDFTQDYDEYEIGIGAKMRVMPKTWAFMRWRYGDRDYSSHPTGTGSTEDNDTDYDWHRVNAGLSWEASPKLNGQLNFGYKWISHENDRDLSGIAFEDPDGVIAGTSLIYTPSARTTLGVGLTRSFQFVGSTTQEYFEDSGVSINFTQELLFDFLFSAGLSYNYSDYNSNGRADDIFGFDLGVDYVIQPWLTAGFLYELELKESSTDSAADNFGNDNEYTNNRLGLMLKLRY